MGGVMGTRREASAGTRARANARSTARRMEGYYAQGAEARQPGRGDLASMPTKDLSRTAAQVRSVRERNAVRQGNYASQGQGAGSFSQRQSGAALSSRQRIPEPGARQVRQRTSEPTWRQAGQGAARPAARQMRQAAVGSVGQQRATEPAARQMRHAGREPVRQQRAAEPTARQMRQAGWEPVRQQRVSEPVRHQMGSTRREPVREQRTAEPTRYQMRQTGREHVRRERISGPADYQSRQKRPASYTDQKVQSTGSDRTGTARTVEKRKPRTKSARPGKLSKPKKAQGLNKNRQVSPMFSQPRPIKEGEVSAQTQKNRARALRMNPIFIAFLCIAVTGVIFCCALYIRLRSEYSSELRNVARLESQLSDLRENNDAELARIKGNVNLEEIKKIAMEQFGMHEPTEDQMESYATADGISFVRQYQDLP